MRIKFEKGITPEVMAEEFLKIIKEHGKLIGTVNMYIQFYDENMKSEKDSIYMTCSAKKEEVEAYSNYAADVRRSALRAV